MLSTKDMATGSGKLRPIMGAGNNLVRINSITMDQTPWDDKAFNITLHVETEDQGSDFDGFLVDRNNESAGRYKGQIARVRVSPFPYKDTTLPSGREISMEKEILKSMIFISEVLNKRKDLDSVEATTIDQFIESCNALFSGSDFFNVCLASRQWENKEGYTQDDLYLPKLSRDGVPMEAVGAEPSRLITFNKADHIRVPEGKSSSEKTSFEPAKKTSTISDFEL
jgi:hypothetical protein